MERIGEAMLLHAAVSGQYYCSSVHCDRGGGWGPLERDHLSNDQRVIKTIFDNLCQSSWCRPKGKDHQRVKNIFDTS